MIGSAAEPKMAVKKGVWRRICVGWQAVSDEKGIGITWKYLHCEKDPTTHSSMR
jgi:hypothetical protein